MLQVEQVAQEAMPTIEEGAIVGVKEALNQNMEQSQTLEG